MRIESSLSFEEKVDRIRGSILESRSERREYYREDAFSQAASIWKHILPQYDYLLDLSPASLRQIRWHTLQQSIGQYYSMLYPRPAPEEISRQLGYVDLIELLPERLWLSEPDETWVGPDYDYCWSFRGRRINRNIVWLQKIVHNIFQSGFFQRFAGVPPLILEVGAWYGGLPHFLRRMCAPGTTCVIADFPEMLMLSATYLAVHNPDAEIYLYHPGRSTLSDFFSTQREYDFVFVPNHRPDWLEALEEIHLFINTHSFQEMSDLQIDRYLEIVSKRLSGFVYSDNLDRHPYNHHLSESVTLHLCRHFDLIPAPEYYDSLWQDRDPLSYACSRIFLGQSRNQKWGGFDPATLKID